MKFALFYVIYFAQYFLKYFVIFCCVFFKEIFCVYFSRIFHKFHKFHKLAECFNDSTYFTILYTLFHSTSLQMLVQISCFGTCFGLY